MNPKKPRNNCLYCNKECKRFGQKFCSNQCQADLNYKEYIERWLKGKEKGVIAKIAISNHIKKWLVEVRGEKCEDCGWNKKHLTTNKVPLELHHIDGNYLNNKPQNLYLLCSNCHSLTPTFKNLNKGKGRNSRIKMPVKHR